MFRDVSTASSVARLEKGNRDDRRWGGGILGIPWRPGKTSNVGPHGPVRGSAFGFPLGPVPEQTLLGEQHPSGGAGEARVSSPDHGKRHSHCPGRALQRASAKVGGGTRRCGPALAEEQVTSGDLVEQQWQLALALRTHRGLAGHDLK